uniref:Uncharacterized protein n=1 Tax=Steinernema glaseri TaxID=37863 RepID=A0A1I8AAU7_9BILA
MEALELLCHHREQEKGCHHHDSHVAFLKSLFVRLGRPMGQLRRDSQASSQVRFSSVLSHPTRRLHWSPLIVTTHSGSR